MSFTLSILNIRLKILWKSGQMNKISIILSNPPSSDEQVERIFGLLDRANQKGIQIKFFLMGNGVYSSKKGQKNKFYEKIQKAILNGTKIKVCKRDLKARSISDENIEQGIEIIEDFDKTLITEIMEDSDKVISW